MRYESHITIDPLVNKSADLVHRINLFVQSKQFRFANLFKSNGLPSDLDSFMTGHSDSFEDLKSRMRSICHYFTELGIGIKRFKIEEILLDSRNGDTI